MPLLSDETRNEHKELVRQALVMSPRASLLQISEVIEKAKGIRLTPNYILKIRKKIYEERKWRFNNSKVDARIAEMQEKAENIQAKLWPIIYSQVATDKNKIAAATAIFKIEKELLEAQMDAGIFDRKLGEVGVGIGVRFNDEQLQPILRAMENYGIVLPEVINVTPKRLHGKADNGQEEQHSS